MHRSTLRQSPLITMADVGRKVTSWWMAYVVAIVVGLFVITLGGSALLGAVWPTEDGQFAAQIKELVLFAAQAVWVIAWVRRYEGRGFRTIGLTGSRPLPKFLVGLAIGVGLNVLVGALLVVSGAYSFTASAPDPGLGIPVVGLVVVALAIVTVQASTEELVFRGFVLQSNARTLPGLAALLLPGIVFSLAHGINPPVAMVTIVLFAMFASLVALRQGDLIVVCGVHTGWNWFSENVIGTPVSGGASKQVALFTMTPNAGADDLLTGGSFGPEASIIGGLVWAALVVIAYLYFRSPGKASAPASVRSTAG